MNTMHEQDAMETSVVAEVASETAAETAAETDYDAVPGAEVTGELGFVLTPGLLEEAEALRGIYPGFNLTSALTHPVLGGLIRGEARPTLRQLYEAVAWQDLAADAYAGRLESEVQSALAEAVEQAVQSNEECLISHIRTRGLRPAEVGAASSVGIRMHPAVERLTRRERAMLAKRAEDGETIQL